MPKIQWTGLPPALRDHLFERLAERQITAEDLYKLKMWANLSPKLLTVSGTKTSVRSNSAVKASSPRRSFYAGKQPRAKS
jgi:hypothetical protein